MGGIATINDVLEFIMAGATAVSYTHLAETYWKASMGGILGDCSCTNGYSVNFENCTYNTERGIGNIHDIDHLIKVWTYAKTIGELEGLSLIHICFHLGN